MFSRRFNVCTLAHVYVNAFVHVCAHLCCVSPGGTGAHPCDTGAAVLSSSDCRAPMVTMGAHSPSAAGAVSRATPAAASYQGAARTVAPSSRFLFLAKCGWKHEAGRPEICAIIEFCGRVATHIWSHEHHHRLCVLHVLAQNLRSHLGTNLFVSSLRLDAAAPQATQDAPRAALAQQGPPAGAALLVLLLILLLLLVRISPSIYVCIHLEGRHVGGALLVCGRGDSICELLRQPCHPRPT